MRDIVVTVPANLWFNWLCEGDLPGDPPAEKGEWDFYTSRPPAGWKRGQRIYVVAHGFLRGYGELVHATPNAFVRTGAGVACTLLENGMPKPMRGFQGWRYATWGRDEVKGWDGDEWATYGLPERLQVDVQRMLLLRRSLPPSIRSKLRSISLSSHLKSMDDVLRALRTFPA